MSRNKSKRKLFYMNKWFFKKKKKNPREMREKDDFKVRFF